MINFLKKYLLCCLFKKKEKEEKVKKIELTSKEEPLFPTNRFKNLVNNVISLGSFKNSKNKLNNNSCKICNKEFNNENKICDCLAKDELHPNSKEAELKIREKYINNSNIINEAIHIDKNPDKLTLLINDIYDIVEKSTLKEDLTPKSLEKVEENLINQICVHIEDYIKE
jgi:hypothetical protein